MAASKGAESGQATVELALTLPFVALLLAGVVEVGLLMADHGRLWHAAREGARVAAVDPDAADVRDAVLRGGLRPLEIEIEPPPELRRQGDPVTLVVRHQGGGEVPLLGDFLRRRPLVARATMRIEQP